MNKTCEDRIESHLESRIDYMRQLWQAYCGESVDDEEITEESIYEFGLAFDYVAPGTFGDQTEPYWRYQISYGGPSEEIRFYSGGPTYTPYRVEFVFLDWFDGAIRQLCGADLDLMLNYWQWFAETETTAAVQEKAMAD